MCKLLKSAPAQQSSRTTPGIVVAALRGGSGKTIFSVGIIAALKSLGRSVAPFKKGPDYIDAGWLALAAGRPCYNLDSFLIDQATLLASYHAHTRHHTDFAMIEGNRGLYDCINTEGKTSTAELAKLLGLPIILCIDATKTTRTMAAVVGGITAFDPDVRIGGVVLNRVAGQRHQSILTRSIEEYTGIPVVGAVPKLRKQGFPERHMGLVPTPEHSWAATAIAAIRSIALEHLDLDRIQALAETARPVPTGATPPMPSVSLNSVDRPRIGILKDAAFQFYYPENLEALEAAGARLVFTSPLKDQHLPRVDALYIGGGFPETNARELEANTVFRSELKAMADAGLPIYAECGGLMYLGERLILPDGEFEMTGVLPAVFGFSRRPQGHGYTIVRVERANPFYPPGTTLLGHEFHYSSVKTWHGDPENLAFSMERGTGFLEGKDGVCKKNVLATYTHIHALGTPMWAHALISKAVAYKTSRKDASAS